MSGNRSRVTILWLLWEVIRSRVSVGSPMKNSWWETRIRQSFVQ